jgi:hypothetical protein
MVSVLRDRGKLRTLRRSTGKQLQRNAADCFRGIQINANTHIARKRLVLIRTEVDAVSRIVDEIVTVDPCFSSADCDLQPRRCGCQLETIAVIVLNAVADDTAEVVTEILRSVGAVKSF